MDGEITNIIYGLFILAIGFVGVGLISMGINVSYYYFFGFIPLIIVLMLGSYTKKRLGLIECYKRFIDEWGKPLKWKRNFKHIRKVFDYIIEKDDDYSFYIDDQTWNDLTMNEIFSIIDRTLTSPGEEILYKILKMPLFNEQELKKRNKFIETLQNNEELRGKIGRELIRLNKKKNNDLPDLLWGNEKIDDSKKFIYIFLSIAPVIPVAAAILTRDINYLMFFPIIMGINLYIHLKTKATISSMVSYIGYLNGMIVSGKELSKIEFDEFKLYSEKLKKLIKEVNALIRKTQLVGRVEGGDPISEIPYMIFLVEERQFFSSIKYIKKHISELKELYITIGEIDALLSAASYRQGLASYSYPEFKKEAKYFSAQDLAHPLIKDAVSNSVTMNEKGIILTGSNMSGKSTFLRTIGVNAVLAQSLYTVTAKQYNSSFFKVMTSISPEDNIMGGKSYYFREAEALLRIIDEGGDDFPLLCIIDEIFRGTNPIERVNASVEILSYLEKNNALPVVATHDLELTDMLKEKYDLYYFTENMEEEGLVFDYKLKNGVCRTRNAVKLLKYLEYPEEIIEKTNLRIEEAAADRE